jgi:predicted transcriptional regulator
MNMNRTANHGRSVREQLAEHLVEEELRAPIVKRISHVAQSAVAAYYQHHHGDNSPSGQMPTNLFWFTDDAKASKHAALLVLIYLSVYENLKTRHAIATTTRESLTAMSFARTLFIYRRHVCTGNQPPISPERAYLLIQHFADRTVWARNANSANGIKLAYCGRCAVPLVVRSHYREVACEDCQRERASAKLH